MPAINKVDINSPTAKLISEKLCLIKKVHPNLVWLDELERIATAVAVLSNNFTSVSIQIALHEFLRQLHTDLGVRPNIGIYFGPSQRQNEPYLSFAQRALRGAEFIVPASFVEDNINTNIQPRDSRYKDTKGWGPYDLFTIDGKYTHVYRPKKTSPSRSGDHSLRA